MTTLSGVLFSTRCSSVKTVSSPEIPLTLILLSTAPVTCFDEIKRVAAFPGRTVTGLKEYAIAAVEPTRSNVMGAEKAEPVNI